jgi:hypothetical protein
VDQPSRDEPTFNFQSDCSRLQWSLWERKDVASENINPLSAGSRRRGSS